MRLFQDTIIITTQYESEMDLEKPDEHISKVLHDISQELVLNDDRVLRKCIADVSANLLQAIVKYVFKIFSQYY